MAHLIDKDHILAKIENLVNTYKECPTRNSYEEGLKDGRLIGYKDALHKIDTLEVKEVDLEKELIEWHDASEVPQLNKELIVVGEFDNALVLSSNSESFKNRKVTKWAYFDDLLKLSNVERIGKNWKEDHVDKCKGCNNVKGCITCVDGDQWAHYEEPASEDLEEEIKRYLHEVYDRDDTVGDIARHFAKWQKEQFEKNRLAACDKMTEEEAEIESDFCIGIIESENRQPTFDDAIKYGMRLQKEQMMAKAFPVEIDSSRSDGRCILSGNFARFETGDKVKVIVIKEG